MATFTEHIQVLIDTETSKASSGFKQLKSDVAQADTSMGKLGAAAKGAGGMLSALPLPVVAGAAVGAGLAIKKLGDDFTKAALDAKKLSSATGLTVEEASKWQEVAGDVGVSTDQLAGAFGKAVKAIGVAPEKFDALGVSVVRAKDGTVDMNETLINAIGAINAIEDPTKKAALASQLFGKSWQELTPLLDQGTDGIRANIAAVSDAKTITDEEVKSAEKWRDTWDTLNDTVEDLTLTLGKLVVDGLGPTLEVVGEMATMLDDLINTAEGVIGPIGNIGEKFALWVKFLSPVGFSLQVVTKGIEALGFAASALETPLRIVAEGVGVVTSALDTGLDSISGWAAGLAGPVSEAGEKWAQSQRDMLTATEDTTTGLQTQGMSLRAAGVEEEDLSKITEGATEVEKEHAEAIDAMVKKLGDEAKAFDTARTALEAKQAAALGAINSELGYRNAIDGVGDSLTDYQQAAADAETANKEFGSTSKEATEAAEKQDDASRDLEGSVLSAAAAAAQMAKDQAEASGKTFTTNDSINAQITGLQDLKAKFPELAPAIDAHIAKLQGIPTDKHTELTVHAQDLDKIIDDYNKIKSKTIFIDFRGETHVGGAATGGPRSGVVLVGEEGPELVALPMGSFVYTAPQTSLIRANGMAGGGLVPPDPGVIHGGAPEGFVTPREQQIFLDYYRNQETMRLRREEAMRAAGLTGTMGPGYLGPVAQTPAPPPLMKVEPTWSGVRGAAEIHLHIDGGVWLNSKAELGRAFTEAVKAYERTAGKVFAAA